MGIIYGINDYFAEHTTFFWGMLLFSTCSGFLLFIISLIHVVRGTKYNYVVMINTAIIVDIACYIIFVIMTKHEQKENIWYFLSVATFVTYHWALSHTYFTCALELPYVLRG